MAEETIIAWTDHTFNPWMGCQKVSEGCKHCYAETLTKNRMGLKLWGPTAKRQLAKSAWANARSWNRQAARGVPGNYGPLPDGRTPHLTFTGSLMDWAEARADLVPFREQMWQTIRESEHLWFQLLTKRPENIPNCLPPDWGRGYPNVWLGTTIEDNRVAWRARALTAVPAVVHFISYEPAIGPADEVDLDGIEWVICGGESGPGYRHFDMQWARDIRDRCVAGQRRPGPAPRFDVHAPQVGADPVAFFMKQGAGWRTELDPFLVEEDGTRWAWKQYPRTPDLPEGVFADPLQVAA